MDFKLQMEQMQALQPGSKERERETERLRQELAAMSQYEWNVAGLLELANFARRLGARKLRAEIYLRIARSDNKVARQWIDEAARTVLGDGEYATAAEIYFTAQERAQSREDQRYYFISGVKALQAGNMLREAVAAADRHVGALANDDDEILRYMIKRSRAANDMARAKAYTKKLMRMSEHGVFRRSVNALRGSWCLRPPRPMRNRLPRRNVMAGMRPYDPETTSLPTRCSSATAIWTTPIASQPPPCSRCPTTWAGVSVSPQVSEWSDRPEEALEQWLYIARRTGPSRRLAGRAAHRAGDCSTTKRCSRRCDGRRRKAT